jgi:peptidoglycan hydrolase CwlO-like protein
VRQQLVFLLQLQQSDVKVRELETAAKQLPAKLDPLRRDLAKLQAMLDGERAKLAETDAWRKQQQDVIDRERDALRASCSRRRTARSSTRRAARSRTSASRSAIARPSSRR